MTTTATLNEEQATGFAADGDQFLTFSLEDEEYGIEILRVQEIKGLSKVHPVPNSPEYIKGVMNLRGTVVPIVDLRCRFGMDEINYNQFTVIIMVNVGEKVIGLIVDGVSDVLSIPNSDIEEAPDLGGDIETCFFLGMGKVNDKLVMLLDVDSLLASEGLHGFDTKEA